MVLLGTGADKDASEDDLRSAREKLIAGSAEILGDLEKEMEGGKSMTVPNTLMEEIHDPKHIYGPLGHYEKLQRIKRRYDPENRFKGWIKP